MALLIASSINIDSPMSFASPHSFGRCFTSTPIARALVLPKGFSVSSFRAASPSMRRLSSFTITAYQTDSSKMNGSVEVANQVLLDEMENVTSGKNLVCSPLFLDTILSMVAVGSSGSTLEQLLWFLGSESIEDLNSKSSRLAHFTLDGESSKNNTGAGGLESTITFVNGAWVDQLYHFKSYYQQLLRSTYQAEAKAVDFVKKKQFLSVLPRGFQSMRRVAVRSTSTPGIHCSRTVNPVKPSLKVAEAMKLGASTLMTEIQTSGASHQPKTTRKGRNFPYPRISSLQKNELHHYQILNYPLRTESAMKKILDENTLVFIVDVRANKKNIRDAFEKMFNIQTKKVNTLINYNGIKKAYIMLSPDYDAITVAKKIKII